MLKKYKGVSLLEFTLASFLVGIALSSFLMFENRALDFSIRTRDQLIELILVQDLSEKFEMIYPNPNMKSNTLASIPDQVDCFSKFCTSNEIYKNFLFQANMNAEVNNIRYIYSDRCVNTFERLTCIQTRTGLNNKAVDSYLNNYPRFNGWSFPR